jgi:hypothetical protein
MPSSTASIARSVRIWSSVGIPPIADSAGQLARRADTRYTFRHSGAASFCGCCLYHVKDISTDSIVVAATNQVSCELAGEAAILDLKRGVYYGLDPVGSAVWQMIAEPRRVSEIRDELLELYDVEPEQCAADLLRLLGDLSARGLIQLVDDATP